ncbi:alpha-mannosidase [Edaphobacter aggregans]|uniref:Alpha-mannosidase n=1 Tax=Edaphobacter aggregans TaxID=570835 RepID=A0A428MKD6_9BACT|nr:alpha-mannosidase [Edaphobacter aggregans]
MRLTHFSCSPRRTTKSCRRSFGSVGILSAVAATLLPIAAYSQTMKAPDITKAPTLYVVPYAHLDTQWRWEMPQTISEYLLKTMRVNFDYMDKYPHYVFNWTGSNRYRLMKEYFPADYARMQKYAAEGRWFPAGSSVEEGDVNLPSAEGIFRQVLYGNEYFRKDFGKASAEYMLPDCFGFPASLPSILAHAGVKGFSTQKLNAQWQPAPKIGGPDSPEKTPEGIPFNVGLWVGPDGSHVLAALNPGGYGSNVYTDLSKPSTQSIVSAPQLTSEERSRLTPAQQVALARPRSVEPNWVERIDRNGKVTGVFADYHYVGTGDIGGATQESTVKLLEAIVTKSETTLPAPPRGAFAMGETPTAEPSGPPVKVGEGPVNVVIATADQMFNDIQPGMESRMPQYQGDLELINHSAGSLTSQAYHKRWITKNELLADAAEKSSIAAQWLGARTYPQQRLNDAWTLELSGHFHDIGAGTATPRAYQYAWNDDIIAANQFAGVLTDATEAITSGLNTQTKGVPIVVFNPLNIEREDLVEANVTFPNGTPKAVRVSGPDGREVPSQLTGGKVLFVAKAPSVGYAIYDVQPAETTNTHSSLKVTDSSLENDRYRVRLDQNGDVSSIYDKALNKELLSGPVRLAVSTDIPKIYPAWNMEFEQEQAAPRAYVSGPAKVRIKENGPVRVSLEVTRNTEGSTFVQTISLSAGDAGNRVEFGNAIDWKTLAANLKASIPLAASNENATYNWGVGTIQRPNANERQFEVASHRWIDLTDKNGSFGTTILTDCKNGSDKPNDNTLRVTLMRSPGMQPSTNGRPQAYTDQANQDWGHHEFVFALAGHADDWRKSQTDWQAYRLNDPLIAFEATKHSGTLGKNFSLMHLDNPRIRVLALKKAEASDEIILRMVELDGKPAQDVRVSFAAPVTAAREVNAQEQPIGSATITDGALATSFTAYQPRTFALRLGAPSSKLASTQSQPVALNYDLAVASNDDTKTEGVGFDGKGDAIPAEMLPTTINYHDVRFDLAPAKTGSSNAVVARGQTINLPAGHHNRVYVLAASSDGDQSAEFKVGDKAVNLNIQDWGGFIGQWDTRIWKSAPERDWAISANHAAWPPADEQQREARPQSPRYPEDYVGLEAGYIKPANVAWYASHHHTATGLNQPYQYSYLFAYPMEVSENTKTLTLPNNEKIRILAISVAQEEPGLIPAQPLYDTLSHTNPTNTAKLAR